jgi:hypothetical protein
VNTTSLKMECGCRIGVKVWKRYAACYGFALAVPGMKAHMEEPCSVHAATLVQLQKEM